MVRRETKHSREQLSMNQPGGLWHALKPGEAFWVYHVKFFFCWNVYQYSRWQQVWFWLWTAKQVYGQHQGGLIWWWWSILGGEFVTRDLKGFYRAGAVATSLEGGWNTWREEGIHYRWCDGCLACGVAAIVTRRQIIWTDLLYQSLKTLIFIIFINRCWALFTRWGLNGTRLPLLDTEIFRKVTR